MLDAADDRTLRLAATPLTPDVLDRLRVYQETFIAHASLPHVGPDAVVAGHARALEAAELDNHTLEKVSAIARAYYAHRMIVRKLEAKLSELGPAGDAELLATLRTERARLDSSAALARRYGEETVSLLKAREPELLPLHERLTQLLGV